MTLIWVVTTIDHFFASFIELCAVPATILFFGCAIILTLQTRFMQFRGFGQFIRLIKQGFSKSGLEGLSEKFNSINPFHALSTAMATTIGMGNIIGPSVAIMAGGPGALFWLLVYIFFASATKFVEVVFALHTRESTQDSFIVGGPMYYLRSISSWLANWYVFVMVFLFIAWSALQANTLAGVFHEEGIAEWFVGFVLALIVLAVLQGGTKRVGFVASKLVPVMFIFYVTFGLAILLTHIPQLKVAIALMWNSVFSSAAPVGGFLGASIYQAMHFGIYRGIYISEAGIGTASIPHAVSDIKNPTDQGLLALYSMASDAFLSSLSGFLVLLTGVWTYGPLRNTLVYEAFEIYFPALGKYVLLLTIALFVLTTIIGNSFNGAQSFASLVGHRWLGVYKFATVTAIFVGAFAPVTLMWNLVDVLLTLVAVPNLLGLVYLAHKYPEVLRLKK